MTGRTCLLWLCAPVLAVAQAPAPVAVEAVHARRVTPPFVVHPDADPPLIRADGPDGAATYEPAVPAAGTYVLWLHGRAEGGGSVPVRAILGEDPPEWIDLGNRWLWIRGAQAHELAAGRHPLRIESAAKVPVEIARLALLPAGVGPDALAAPPDGGAPKTEPGAIVIDNHDAEGRFSTTGDWRVDEAGGDWAGTPCHWTTPDRDGKSPAAARWQTKLPKAGRWKIYVWYGDDPVGDHASDAPYTIEHADGAQTVKVDEKRNTRRWNLLGTFRFDPAKPAAVVLTNKASSNIIADGVKFVPE